MNAYDISLRQRAEHPPTPAQLAARIGRFRINFLNKLIRQNAVRDCVHLGRADGKLLDRLKVLHAAELDGAQETTADLALSFDVIDRLTGDGEFNAYLRTLFGAARRYVVIHGNAAAPVWDAPNAQGRRFKTHVARYFPAWRLAAQVPNPFPRAAAGEFCVYARDGTSCVIPVMALV